MLYRYIHAPVIFLAQAALSSILAVAPSSGGDASNIDVSKRSPTESTPTCRYLPGDAGWPSPVAWSKLNQTVGGRLIRGVPLGKPCYTSTNRSSPDVDPSSCTKVKDEWISLPPFLDDPVNVMSPYWMNNSCNPFFGPDGACTLGNLASYAIDVSSAHDAIAGVKFAEAHNIRLTVKNTGHDYLGRSVGKGSLALWTHNLKGIDFLHYTSRDYTGPAVRIGAGVEGSEILAAASAHGLRTVIGACSTVGVAGGYTQGGGHSPLGAKYGLGADQVLQWEVVTPTGQHLTVSPSTSTPANSDLFWALSGGGPGNYAVVLSMTVKAHPDGPVAGASFSFYNTDDTAFWAAVSAWLRHLLVLDAIPGFSSAWSLTSTGFELFYATLPDATAAAMTQALDPVIAEIEALNVSLVSNTTAVQPDFRTSYEAFLPQAYVTNATLGGRLIPRSLVETDLPALVAVMRTIAGGSSAVGGSLIDGIAANVTHLRVGNGPRSNAVLPAWRDSLFHMNVGVGWSETADWATMRAREEQLGAWQAMLRAITPGGGSYMNEGTYDDPAWKEDYFGANYDALLRVKRKYDPSSLLWANAAVGSDRSWTTAADGRLCRV